MRLRTIGWSRAGIRQRLPLRAVVRLDAGRIVEADEESAVMNAHRMSVPDETTYAFPLRTTLVAVARPVVAAIT